MRSGILGNAKYWRSWPFFIVLGLTACALPNQQPQGEDIYPNPHDRGDVETHDVSSNTRDNLFPTTSDTVDARSDDRPDVHEFAAIKPHVKPLVTSLKAQSFIGLDTMTVLAQLGPPDQQSLDPPMLRWQYTSGPCVVQLQFFQELSSDKFRALQYDIEGGSESACLARLERRNQS